VECCFKEIIATYSRATAVRDAVEDVLRELISEVRTAR
jgi:hypothetical protein